MTSSALRATFAVVLSNFALNAQQAEDLYRATADRLLPSVQEELRSPVALRVAWAAYCVRKLQIAAAAGDLQRALTAWTDKEGAEARHVRRVILDALLQLDLHVPKAALAPHIAETPAFLMLCGDSAHESTLLSFMDEPLRNSSMRWLAAGNLISAGKSAGAAAAILRQSVFFVYIDALDPQQQSPDRRTVADRSRSLAVAVDAEGKGAETHAINASPAGFPPAVRYELTSEGRPRMTLIAPGHYSVFVRFDEKPGFSYEAGLRPEDRDGVTWSWLQVLLDEPTLPRGRVQEIQFRSEQQFRDDVAAARLKCDRDMSSLLDRLVSAGRLTDAEAKNSRPTIRVLLQDLRKNTGVALPRIDGVLGY